MLSGLIPTIFRFFIVFAFLLFLVNYRWFGNFVDEVIRLLQLLLDLLIQVCFITIRSVFKAAVVALLAISLVFMYIITFLVPQVGEKSQKVNSRLSQYINAKSVISLPQRARKTMVEIVAEHDKRSLKYEEEEKYREELIKVRESAKRRLEIGESVLSLAMGGVLLISAIYKIQLFQANLYGHSVGTLVQLYLFIVAVSILYRVSALDILAYTGEERFSSMQGMDVALSYQMAISLADFMQVLMLVFVSTAAITRTSWETIEPVLEKNYAENLSFWETISLAWREIKED